MDENINKISKFEENWQTRDHRALLSKHIKASICRRSKHGDLLAHNSLPLTEVTVDLFNENLWRSSSSSSASDLNIFDVEYVSRISEKVYISPCTIMLALVYIDRVKQNDPDYVRKISSCDLFLVSMMIASKFLFDDGEDEEVFNNEWADSVNCETKYLNNLEREFLTKLDWNLYVDKEQIFQLLFKLEHLITLNECRKRAWSGLTYEEISLLFDNEDFQMKFQIYFQEYILKALIAISFTYTIVVVGLIGASMAIAFNHNLLIKHLRNEHLKNSEKILLDDETTVNCTLAFDLNCVYRMKNSLYPFSSTFSSSSSSPFFSSSSSSSSSFLQRNEFNFNYISLGLLNCSRIFPFAELRSTCVI